MQFFTYITLSKVLLFVFLIEKRARDRVRACNLIEKRAREKREININKYVDKIYGKLTGEYYVPYVHVFTMYS